MAGGLQGFLFLLLPPGEPGLLLTKVVSHQPFVGYRGPRELSERKLVRNVRQSGDVYYNTGDVLAMDREGFLYFRDRLGDTFRSEAGFLRAGLGRDLESLQILEGASLKRRDFPIVRGRSLESGFPTRRRGFSILEGAGLTGPPNPQKGQAGRGKRRGLSLPGAWSQAPAPTPQMEGRERVHARGGGRVVAGGLPAAG